MLAVGLCGLAAFVLVHLALGGLARWASECVGAHLWWRDEQLDVLEPARYRPTARPLLVVYGPSVAREAVLPDRFEQRLPELALRDDSHSITTRTDVLRYLEVLERHYGADAIPDHLVLTWTPRMLADVGAKDSALQSAIDRYLPTYVCRPIGSEEALAPKSAWEGLASRWRALGHERGRYKNALRTAGRVLTTRPLDLSCGPRDLGPRLGRAVYRGRPAKSLAEVEEKLVELGAFWRQPFTFDFPAERERILRDLAWIRAFCERHGTRLYVVTMPERSQYRSQYRPGVYEAFEQVLEEAFAGLPWARLRTRVGDDGFYDLVHVNRAGARVVTDAMVELVRNSMGG